MGITLSGVIHGRRIELDAEPAMPDGASVTVKIDERVLATAEKRRRVLATAGAWATDPSIERVFEELAGRRREARPRDSAGG